MKSSMILSIGLTTSLIFAFTSESFLILLLALIFIAAIMRIANSDRASEFISRLGKYFHEYRDRPMISRQTFTDEQQWLPGETRRYIPNRNQALVVSIVSALLYYRMFGVLFTGNDGAQGACGSLIRPALATRDGVGIGWISDIWSDVNNAQCPRTMMGLYNEFFFLSIALAFCRLVLRRAIKRDSPTVL